MNSIKNHLKMKKKKLIVIISLLMIPTISLMVSTNFKRNSVDLSD